MSRRCDFGDSLATTDDLTYTATHWGISSSSARRSFSACFFPDLSVFFALCGWYGLFPLYMRWLITSLLAALVPATGIVFGLPLLKEVHSHSHRYLLKLKVKEIDAFQKAACNFYQLRGLGGYSTSAD